MSECKCNLRTRVVGDGCEKCNPQMAIELLNERLDELRAAADQADEEYRAEIASLRLTDAERKAIGRLCEATSDMIDDDKRADGCHWQDDAAAVAVVRGLMERLK